MLEPGKTYFLLYDFKEGRRFFMGDDCRLQNEFFKYPLDWGMQMKEGEDIDKYVASVDSLIKARNASVDKLCMDDPTLSTRFNKYKKGSILWQLANDLNNA